jgi:glycosyltransferase involved in cell wall biosynthesis
LKHYDTKSKFPNQKSAPRLSVCMIVKNEERYLEGCLESIRSVADEIVVVDTGSNDSTMEIANRFGAKLFIYEWDCNFAAARNYALANATGEWILSIDADERLQENQTILLRSMLKNPQATAYTVLISGDHYLPTGVMHQINSYPRLFRRLDGIMFEGKVHEQITPSVLRKNLKILPSNLTVNHLGYGNDLATVQFKAKRNLEILRKELIEDPSNHYIRFQVGNTLSVLEEYDLAEKELKLIIESQSIAKSIVASTHNLLAEINIRKGVFDRAVSNALLSLTNAGYQITARWYLSAAYIGLEKYENAIDPLLGILEILRDNKSQRKDEIAFDIVLDETMVRYRLGVCYEYVHRYSEATEAYFQVLLNNQSNEEALHSLIRTQQIIAESNLSIAQLEALRKKGFNKAQLLVALAVNYRKIGKHNEAYEILRETTYLHPMEPQPYALEIKWRIEDGDFSAAEAVFDESQRMKLSSFDLNKAGLDLALQRGEIVKALQFLEKMADSPTGATPLVRERIKTLRSRLTPVTNPN